MRHATEIQSPLIQNQSFVLPQDYSRLRKIKTSTRRAKESLRGKRGKGRRGTWRDREREAEAEAEDKLEASATLSLSLSLTHTHTHTHTLFYTVHTCVFLSVPV
jgi:hypothetical protein